MTLEINGILIKQVPIKAKEIEFDKDGKSVNYSDKDGNFVKKINVCCGYSPIFAKTLNIHLASQNHISVIDPTNILAGLLGNCFWKFFSIHSGSE